MWHNIVCDKIAFLPNILNGWDKQPTFEILTLHSHAWIIAAFEMCNEMKMYAHLDKSNEAFFC